MRRQLDSVRPVGSRRHLLDRDQGCAAAACYSGKIASGQDNRRHGSHLRPNEYKDASGEPIGWEVELMNAAAGKLGVKPVYAVAKFDSIPKRHRGKYDVARPVHRQ
jgi:ABC-type amino acid transport substrate-binding protein